MAVFNYPISYSSSLELNTRSVDIQFGDGYQLSSEEGINAQVKKWNVRFINISPTMAGEIKAFYKTNKAATTPFTWVDPNGETGRYKWRNYTESFDGFGHRTISGVFEEVFQ